MKYLFLNPALGHTQTVHVFGPSQPGRQGAGRDWLGVPLGQAKTLSYNLLPYKRLISRNFTV